MNIVVTGATGFIGRHLCVALADVQHNVTMVSRSAQKGADQYSRIPNPIDLQHDVDYDTLLKDCDVVIHLAGRTHILNDPHPDPVSAFASANTIATLNLARAAAARGVKRFIFLSSIKVNGESTMLGTPFTPESPPHPTDGYGQSKLDAELGLFRIAESSPLEVVVIRPPLVYGPGVRANFLELMNLVYKQIPMPLGSVKNKRSFVGTDNAKLLHREHHYIRLCESLQVDISMTMNILGWKPVSTPESILQKTVEHAGFNSRD